MKNNSKYITLIFLIIIAGITFGYNISVIASTLPKIKLEFLASEKIISLIAGLVFGGTMLAKLMMSVFNDNFGRRHTLIIATGIFLLGTTSIVIAKSIDYILVGRLLQGVGGGLLMFTTSLYIVEIANDRNRGKLTALYQLSFTVGLFLANVIGIYMYDINWRVTFECLLVLTVIFLFTIYKLPCSPRWLYWRGKESAARCALAITHSANEVNQVIESWQESGNLEKSTSILQKRYLKALTLVVIITFLHQFTGINAILQTSTVLLQDAGMKQIALSSNILITGINVVMTLIGIQIIEKFPRNMLLGVCGLIIACAHFIIAINFFTGVKSPILLLGGLTLFISAYAIGPGIIIWLVFSEYLPTPVRSKGIAIAGFINALAGFIISSSFIYLNATYGLGWIFLGCGVFSLIYGLIPIFYLPDTQGKNLEKFDELFKVKTSS